MASMTLDNLVFSMTEQWRAFAEKNSWAAFIPETTKDSNGTEYMRRRGNPVIYKKTPEGLECAKCHSTVMSAQVAHPIHDSPIPLSGSGQCHYEEVPYCPKCEKKPDYNGSIITDRL